MTIAFWLLVSLIWFITREIIAANTRERARQRDEALGEYGTLTEDAVERFRYLDRYKSENNLPSAFMATCKAGIEKGPAELHANMSGFLPQCFGGIGFIIIAIQVLHHREHMSSLSLRWATEVMKLWREEDRPENWYTELVYKLNDKSVTELDTTTKSIARTMMRLEPEMELKFLSKKERKKRF
jgi:hypothetical protein